MAMKIFHNFLLVVGVAIVGVCFYALIVEDGKRKASANDCHAKGGIVVVSEYDRRVCVRVDIIKQ
jgi:hypothetical protein